MIYVVQSVPAGPLKVGYTENFEKRLKQLRHGIWTELRIEYLWHGTREQEQSLLRSLRKWRIRGEWFYPHREVWVRLEEFASYVSTATRPTPALSPTAHAALLLLARRGDPIRVEAHTPNEAAFEELCAKGLAEFLHDERRYQVTRDGIWAAKGWPLT